jgi:cytochrome c oxidase assembly protein Cox11
MLLANLWRRNLNHVKVILTIACLALFLSGCRSTPQSLIIGKWEVETGLKVTAEFARDGTATLTMFGQTLHGTYKLNAENELEWNLNGRTTKNRVTVGATELEVTNAENQTIKYKRK